MSLSGVPAQPADDTPLTREIDRDRRALTPVVRRAGAAMPVRVARNVGHNVVRTAGQVQRVGKGLADVAQAVAFDRQNAKAKGKQLVVDARVLLKQARATVDPREIAGGFAGLTAGEVVGGAVGGVAGTLVGGPAGGIVGAEVGAFTAGMLGMKLGADGRVTEGSEGRRADTRAGGNRRCGRGRRGGPEARRAAGRDRRLDLRRGRGQDRRRSSSGAWSGPFSARSLAGKWYRKRREPSPPLPLCRRGRRWAPPSG